MYKAISGASTIQLGKESASHSSCQNHTKESAALISEQAEEVLYLEQTRSDQVEEEMEVHQHSQKKILHVMPLPSISLPLQL
jgi:3-polyprenyl-4-hydroxybenzoate decarboxylase